MMESFNSKRVNNENDINKIDEGTKGLKVQSKSVIIMQRNNLQFEKKSFCSDDVKKHVSIICKLEFILLNSQCQIAAYRFWETKRLGDNAQKMSQSFLFDLVFERVHNHQARTSTCGGKMEQNCLHSN